MKDPAQVLHVYWLRDVAQLSDVVHLDHTSQSLRGVKYLSSVVCDDRNQVPHVKERECASERKRLRLSKLSNHSDEASRAVEVEVELDDNRHGLKKTILVLDKLDLRFAIFDEVGLASFKKIPPKPVVVLDVSVRDDDVDFLIYERIFTMPKDFAHV